ncbi:MAG: TIGR00266 family protein [Nitrosopumilaceae archaeon]
MTAEKSYYADILVDGEKIKAIGSGLESDGVQEIDASGKLIMPGGIDPHTHFDLPMFDTVSSDDHYTGHKAAAFGGESFFVNEFIAHEDDCTLGLTGNMLGDIEVIHVDEEYIIQSGAFIGSTNGLTLDTEWQGFTKGIFGSNLFMLKTMGEGDMFVNGWGGIISKKLEPGEKMILDNYQLVALSSSAQYRVSKHGSLKTSLFGGEALVIEITGPGTVYMQTKNFMEFVRAIIPYLPKRN